METRALPLDGLLLLTPRVFADARGFFVETFRAGALPAFVQDNQSRSSRGVVRGMHFQRGRGDEPGQAKLVRVARGRIFDVAVDVRPGSPTFGRWHGEELDDVTHRQLFIPAGFAHGFCVLSEAADVCYKVSSFYDPTLESGFQYDDPAVGIAWPLAATEHIVSARDRAAAPLSAIVGTRGAS
jgi:dTDP-4-dehydrorhamnose 3,5-epimerase